MASLSAAGRKTGGRCRVRNNNFNALGEEKFFFEVLDRLQPRENPDYDYGMDLQALESMWLEKLQPFGSRGYHKRKPVTPIC